MRKFILLTAIVLSSVLHSCSQSDGESLNTPVKNKVFQESRIYLRNNFASDEACKEYQLVDPLINCYQSIEFGIDGRVFIVLTDIVNVGLYKIIANKIYVLFDNFDSGQSNEERVFTLATDQKKITDNQTDEVWFLL